MNQDKKHLPPDRTAPT